MIIAPSLLSADFSNLEEEVKNIEKAGADWLHLDIMDGHFVPNLTFGAPVIKALRKHTNLFFDAHLMVSNPLKLIEDYKDAGVDQITVHIETLKHPKQDLKKIKNLGLKTGLTLKPKTSINEVIPYLEYCDNILIMTVNPGFGGQSFIKEQVSKINIIKNNLKNNKLTIQVDGGINKNTLKPCLDAGANCFVAGSAIFNGSKENYSQNIKKLRDIA